MSQNNNNTTPQSIKFKSTNTSHQVIQINYEQDKSVLEYKEIIAQKLAGYEGQPYEIKLIYKGKVLKDKQKVKQLFTTAQQKGKQPITPTVMMVVTHKKKQQKPQLSSSQQTIPRAGMNTGLGSSSPVGFGGYSIMNHPQYMSAISSAVNEQKLEEMMDDPFYQQMMQQMLDDPDTLKQLIEQNPMTRQMMEQNPSLKMIMSNPALMKMVFNKDMIKMAKQMQKNGNMNAGSLSMNNGGLGAFGSMNQPNQNQQQSLQQSNSTNPINPFMGMMGSGFGNNNQNPNQMGNFGSSQQQQNLFNPMMGMGMNPFMFGNLSNNQNSQNPTYGTNSSQQGNNNNLSSMFQNLCKLQQNAQDEQKYKKQLQQLKSMGFSDKEKCINFLKSCNGDIDSVLQKLCLDQDQKQKPQQTQQSNK